MLVSVVRRTAIDVVWRGAATARLRASRDRHRYYKIKARWVVGASSGHATRVARSQISVYGLLTAWP